MFKQDKRDPAYWIVRVGHYSMGVTPQMHPFLEWAVAQPHAKINDDMIRLCQEPDDIMAMIDCQLLKLSETL